MFESVSSAGSAHCEAFQKAIQRRTQGGSAFTQTEMCKCFSHIPMHTAVDTMKCNFAVGDSTQMYTQWEACQSTVQVCDKSALTVMSNSVSTEGYADCKALGVKLAGGSAVTWTEKCKCYIHIPTHIASVTMKCNYAVGDSTQMYTQWQTCQPTKINGKRLAFTEAELTPANEFPAWAIALIVVGGLALTALMGFVALRCSTQKSTETAVIQEHARRGSLEIGVQ